jgi:DNA-binding XRE family transcriptional regulator
MPYTVVIKRQAQKKLQMNAPLNIQTIKSITGKPEYVLIPIAVYNALREEIEEEIAGLEAVTEKNGDYVPFALEDYVDNPVALARIKANVTQQQLAKRMDVTQAYISKIEHQEKATPKLLAKIKAALARKA